MKWPLEKKLTLIGLIIMAIIAISVFSLGTWKAVEGSTIYMMAGEGRTYWEATAYAAMIAGIALLASNAAVFLDAPWKRIGMMCLAVTMAGVTIYTTHAGKEHDSSNQIDESRKADRDAIVAEIAKKSESLSELQKSLSKMTGNLSEKSDSPADDINVPTCTKGMDYYKSCLSNRKAALAAKEKQTRFAIEMQAGAGEQQKTIMEAVTQAEMTLSTEKGRLSAFDVETNRLKAEKVHDSLLTNTISSVMPELASLLGSLFTGIFLKAISLILRETHTAQQEAQLPAQCCPVLPSELGDSDLVTTRAKTEQWSVIDDMSKIQQSAQTPLEAEQAFSSAIDNGTAPLSRRAALEAFPLLGRNMFEDICEVKFRTEKLNKRIDAGNRTTWEYPEEGSEGGKTLYTESAQARRSKPTKSSVVYLPVKNREGVMA